MEGEAGQGVDWVHLPVIATAARLLCREPTLRIYRDFFNGHRPHQDIGNWVPERQAAARPDQPRAMRDRELALECEQFLGGLLNSYYRKAA